MPPHVQKEFPMMNDTQSPAWSPVSDLIFTYMAQDNGKPDASDEADPWTEDDAPVQLTPRLRLLLLRLCAGIGTLDRLAQLTQTGRFSILSNVPPDSLRDICRLIDTEVVPAAICALAQATSGAPLYPASSIAPYQMDEVVPKSAERDLHARIHAALDLPNPILVVLPLGYSLHTSLAGAAALHLPLPKVDRASLATYLRQTQPEHCAPNLEASLPEDEALAALSEVQLLNVLRSGTAAQIVAKLALLCRPDPRPRLSDLPDSPAKAAAQTLIQGLKLWTKGAPWADLPHALLLYGPPGTGKSYLARAMGAEPGLRFVQASFAQWQAAGHLGDMLGQMLASFAEAAASAPCILFIDEVDAAGNRDATDHNAAAYRRQVTNAFLEQIDLLNLAGGVVLVGACNDPTSMDAAVLRAGRFDRKVEMPLPDRATIAAQLTSALSSQTISAQTIAKFASRLIGQSPAAIDAALRSAKTQARIEARDLAVGDLVVALPLTHPDPEGEARIAVHEAGHALVAAMLGHGEVLRVALTATGGSTERFTPANQGSLADFEDELTITLAGHAAERLIFDEVSSGSGGSPTSDLALATNLALSLELQSGLGTQGLIWSEPPTHLDPRSPLHAALRKRLEAAEQRAFDLLSRNTEGLTHFAQGLMQTRDLAGAPLQSLIAEAMAAGEDEGETLCQRFH
jgi:cell division protease FtsH